MYENPVITVVGLGYVGLPLAVALARHFEVMGYDIDEKRIAELRSGHDRTGELSRGELTDSALEYVTDPEALKEAHIFIVTVPTPVDAENKPDLRAVESASRFVGSLIRMGSVVVYESTVYPGCTEAFCGPILEAESDLIAGQDFFLGYSPERINPGDKVHRVDSITKVVAGQTEKVAQLLAQVYGAMNGNDTFIARDIRTAEASKVIENAQRDINIAFVNEIAEIFGKMGLSIYDVLEAANTKWNFLPFSPGLVGGHCIGVDPYYLAHAAEKIGVDPRVILSGRRINDNMARSIAARLDAELPRGARILMLGFTFKENVPDIRNTKVIDLVRALEEKGHDVAVYDPIADADEIRAHYDLSVIETPELAYDAVVGAVPHSGFAELPLRGLVRADGLVADIKGIWRKRSVPQGLRYWTL
ncbi:nucleotide sugar dehydrogenase [Marivibrio halodurans]|uniref:Nucleotide sugar dehydrogenase n=1 Tax=Marivibrio halodurans TaxID=2039722 RepID=A0A8J7SHS2_9PROT|nr:nucleotide sugar dehydrogenase [Marivibrio halodurans]MBP5856613.1 nucleotide sugar dehydrogenase [Marivibrio halodurans]